MGIEKTVIVCVASLGEGHPRDIVVLGDFE